MNALNEADTRSLIELLALALERRDPPALVDSARRAWGRGRLGRAADQAAAALRRGESLSSALVGRLPPASVAALAAGEVQGDPAAGIARAARALGRCARSRKDVLAPAAYPLAVLSVAGLAGVVLTLLAAPSLQALRVELAAFAGRPEPVGLVAWAAAHPVAAVTIGATLALLPLLLPLVFAWLPRTHAGCALMLKLPLVASAVRWRACADLLESLGDLIAGGVPHEEAWRLACASVGPSLPRLRLLALSPAAAGGAPFNELIASAGLPSAAAHALKPEQLRQDGGVEALRRTAEEADAAHERFVILGGRALTIGTSVAGVAAAAGLLAAVLLPLFQAGSF